MIFVFTPPSLRINPYPSPFVLPFFFSFSFSLSFFRSCRAAASFVILFSIFPTTQNAFGAVRIKYIIVDKPVVIWIKLPNRIYSIFSNLSFIPLEPLLSIPLSSPKFTRSNLSFINSHYDGGFDFWPFWLRRLNDTSQGAHYPNTISRRTRPKAPDDIGNNHPKTFLAPNVHDGNNCSISKLQLKPELPPIHECHQRCHRSG